MRVGRYIVYGAGGIGASLGAQLHQAGRDVVLIARGAQLAAIAGKGLPQAQGSVRTVIESPRS